MQNHNFGHLAFVQDFSPVISLQDGLYLLSHNMVTTMGQSSWLLILADG